jgi:hypothetical protein
MALQRRRPLAKALEVIAQKTTLSFSLRRLEDPSFKFGYLFYVHFPTFALMYTKYNLTCYVIYGGTW